MESSTMQLYRSAQSHHRPAKKDKIHSQRQYRVKEGDGFQELRDIICSLTGKSPQTRRDVLTKAAELLKKICEEDLASSRYDPLPALESPLYELNQRPQEFYEPFILPNNEAWTNANTTGTRNSSPMSDSSATSSLPEFHGHPQAEGDYPVNSWNQWNLVQPTPSQFRQYSSQAQRNDLPVALNYSNVDQVPFY